MKKSISQWAFSPDRPLPQVFALAREHGFDGVEVAIALDGPITPQSTPDECALIREQAHQAKIELASLASGFGWQFPISTSRRQLRRKSIELASHSLQVARYLGLDALLMVPGGVGAEFVVDFAGEPYEVAYENARAALRELASVAQKCDVHLGVENVWNKFLLSPLEMRDLLDGCMSTHVGSYFDVGNVLLTGYPEQWISVLGKRICRVHLKDWKRSIGTLDGFCPLLEGDVDYPAVMKALRRIGYDSFLTAEYFNCEADLGAISRAMDLILEM